MRRFLIKGLLLFLSLNLAACSGENVLTNTKNSDVDDRFENAGGDGASGGNNNDNEPPAVSNVSISSPADVSIANASMYVVSGTCDSDLSFITITASSPDVTEVVLCIGDAFTATLDVTGIASNPIAITAAQGEFSEDASAANDQIPATVTVTSGLDIDLDNASSYSFSGACSEETEDVVVSVGGVSPLVQPICTGGAWSVTGLDVLAASDGSINILADHIDAAGNAAVQASLAVNKDMNPFMLWASATQTVGSTNVNTTADDLEWSGILISNKYFEIGPVNIDEINVKIAGDYRLSLTLPVSTLLQRSNIIAQVKVNSVVVNGAFSASSYIRTQSGHNSSSDHIDIILNDLAVNDIVEVEVGIEAIAGTVSISSAAYLFMEPILADKVFVATATQVIGGTNLNNVAVDSFEWSQQKVSTPFAHSDVTNPEQVSLSLAGNYFVSVNIPIDSTVERASIRSQVTLDGAPVSGSSARQGYIRSFSGHNTASVHWQGLLEGVTAGQVLEIETSLDAEVGAATISAGQAANLSIEKIENTNFISLSGVDVTAGTNWNQTSSVDWATQNSIDAVNFSHNTGSNPEEVTVLSEGSYFISYTDSQTSTAERPAVIISVIVNGVATGLICDTHYMRSLSGHNNSSCSLSGLLDGLSAGDVIRIDTEAGALAGSVTSNDDAKLFILKK